jgi:hypothetical protein
MLGYVAIDIIVQLQHVSPPHLEKLIAQQNRGKSKERKIIKKRNDKRG